MTIYVLNTLVVPVDFENYEHVTVKIRKASVEEVRRLLQKSNFISAVGHQATATFLSTILNIEIPFNRITVKVKPGDVLVHFVLRTRIPEGKILSYEELSKLEFDLAISEVLEHGHQ
jgi:hypothetical protein